jgi:hypothetical protein
MRTIDPSAKVQIIGPGAIPIPGICVCCNKSYDEHGFAIMGAFLEFYGEILFCRGCSLQLIEAWGGLGPDEYDELDEKFNATVKKNAQLTSELEQANAQLNDLRHAISVLGLNISPALAGTSISEDKRGSQSVPESADLKPVDSGAGKNSKPSESDTVDGPNDTSGSESPDLRDFGF